MSIQRRVAAIGLAMLVLTIGACQSTTTDATSPPVDPTPAASTGNDTSTWVDYTAPDDAFALKHPADWQPFPEGGRTFFSGGATWGSGITVGRYDKAGLEPAAWVEANCGRQMDFGVNKPDESGGLVSCDVPLDGWTSTTVDGRPASLDVSQEACCLDVVVFTDDAAYVITSWGGTSADRPLVDAFVSTIRLEPGA